MKWNNKSCAFINKSDCKVTNCRSYALHYCIGNFIPNALDSSGFFIPLSNFSSTQMNHTERAAKSKRPLCQTLRV